MAGRRKDDLNIDAGAERKVPAPVVRDAAPSCKVGDVVMYAHRPMTAAENVPAMFMVPMMITTYNPGSHIVNGVVFSDNVHLGFVGSKVVSDVKMGTGPGEWQPRT